MRDAKQDLGRLDLLELPDVLEEAIARRPSPHDEPATRVRGGPHRIVAAVVALIVFGGAAVFTVRAFDTTPKGPVDNSTSTPASPSQRGVWQALPAPPTPYRQGAGGFWVDGRVVIFGGSETAPPCPRFANCDFTGKPAPLSGIAFDPATDRWATIAGSPMPIMSYTGAVLGDTLYVWGSTNESTEMRLLAYSAAEDRWNSFSPPSREGIPASFRLTAADDVLVAFADSQERGYVPDFQFDPASGAWSELPRDPLFPSFDRSMVWTGTELVLIGTKAEAPQVATYEHQVATLDIASGTWRQLRDSITMGDPTWFWSASRVVNPEIGRVGDSYSTVGTGPPYGGIFEPSAGRWSELPPAPKRLVPYGGPSVGGDRYVVTEQGAILDVATETWEALPAPPVVADEQAVAVWAGDRLIVWGGYRWDNSFSHAQMVDAGWWWIPNG
jgi:hypothetical protein